MNIVVMDDPKSNTRGMRESISSAFQVVTFTQSDKLMGHLKDHKTDMVLLDMNHQSEQNFALYEKLKEDHHEIPIVFLSENSTEDAIIKGLEMGADDVLYSPISLNIMIAKIKNRIQKCEESTTSKSKVSMQGLTLHLEMQTAEINGKKITLTPTEYKLIYLLMKNPNKIFTRDYITSYLWPEIHVQNQNLDTHLSNLRKKLHPFSSQIKTIKSRGYLLRV